jgi:hypothetical protein
MERFAGLAGLGVSLLASSAFGQPHAGDVFLAVENGQIVTAVDNMDGSYTRTRVYGSELGELFPNYTDEPGFDSLPGTFPPGRIGFRIMTTLRRWTGANFNTIPPERMEVAFSTLSALTPVTPQVVEGFTLAVSANGQWHRHLEFTLLEPAATGVYLLELQLFSTSDLNPSDPFWIVFNQNESEPVHEAAIQWVIDNLDGGGGCGSADFDGDGDTATDADIEAFFACLAGNCCASCGSADFDGDGDTATDADIEMFFMVLAGGQC